MNKALFLILFLIIQSFSVHAAEEEKFSYCGGNLKFYIPTLFNKKLIEKQGDPYTCKYGFIVTNKKGNIKTKVDVSQIQWITDLNFYDEEYIKQFEKKGLRHFFSIYQNISVTGTTTVLSHRWVSDMGVLKKIEKSFYFGKEGRIFAADIYSADPKNPDEVLFMSALEQLFLSMEIDW
ncbi:hypothetical protein ACVBEF_00720 [Glaciimonas sp. GG7]